MDTNKHYVRAGWIAAVFLAGITLHILTSQLIEKQNDWPIEETYVNLPSEQWVRIQSLGYNQLLADVTWARMLVYYGTGIIEQSDFRYLGKFIRNIMTLDPRFKKLYQWAAYSVTITSKHQVSTEDEKIRLSLEVTERAMQEFPEDYEFFWIAGTTYFLDLKSEDPEIQRRYKQRGAQLLEIAMHKANAPKDLATKAASFHSQLGEQEQARSALMQMILTTDDPKAQATMMRNYKHLVDADLANELADATKQFGELRDAELHTLPADIFVLLGGPSPSPVISFEDLATDRDLFGVDIGHEIDLFP